MDSVASSLPEGFSLVGGIPVKSQDFAACDFRVSPLLVANNTDSRAHRSIIFIVAFVLLIPLALWRIVRKSTRSTVLIRPCIVLVVRIATYAIRAVEANGNYAEGLFIAEQVRSPPRDSYVSLDLTPRSRRSCCSSASFRCASL